MIQWPEPLPEDPASMLKQLSEEVAMGVISLQTAAEQLGRSWALERRRIRIEKKQNASLGQWFMTEFDRGGGGKGNGGGQFGGNNNGRGNDGDQENTDGNQ